MNINVATWGRLLKRNTPNIQNQQGGSITDSSRHSPSNDSSFSTSISQQPLQMVFETSSDEFETVVAPGENPDHSVMGLSGARPLGMQGVSTLPPDSPPTSGRCPTSPNNNVALPPKPLHLVTQPSSFRQKKPPMPSPPLPPTTQPPPPPASRMDPEVCEAHLLMFDPYFFLHKLHTLHS